MEEEREGALVYSFFFPDMFFSSQPTKEFQSNDYSVRAVDLEFSLANRTHELTLPAATFTYSKEDGSEGLQRTASVVLTVSGPPIPEGDIDQPLIVLALTIVFPVVAAFFAINALSQRSGGGASKKRK